MHTKALKWLHLTTEGWKTAYIHFPYFSISRGLAVRSCEERWHILLNCSVKVSFNSFSTCMNTESGPVSYFFSHSVFRQWFYQLSSSLIFTLFQTCFKYLIVSAQTPDCPSPLLRPEIKNSCYVILFIESLSWEMCSASCNQRERGFVGGLYLTVHRMKLWLQSELPIETRRWQTAVNVRAFSLDS